MKLNKWFLFAVAALTLTSCQHDNKIYAYFEYQKDPQLVEITGKELYNLTIVNKVNLPVFYSVEGCAACNDLKQQMKAYSKKESCNTYYIDMTSIKKDDYEYIIKASTYANNAFEFPAYGTTLSLPFMDIYAYQGVVLRFNDAFVDYLLKFTKVNTPEYVDSSNRA